MFNKFKQWLGIEGVKIELIIPDTFSNEDTNLEGIVRFYSMNTQTVTWLRVHAIETYKRGRGDSKRIDNYTLGSIELQKNIVIVANQVLDIPFTLPIKHLDSAMDELGNKNALTATLVRAAKWANATESKYFVIAEAKVKGTKLDPFDEQEITKSK